jgi:ADP-heptose:LPS heptosyltransferase
MALDLNIDNMQNEETSLWHEDALQRKFKPVSAAKLRELGIGDRGLRKVDKLSDLRESPPNIIVAEAARTFSFIQNFFKVQTLKKKAKYVMGLGVFQQLQYDETMKNKLLKPSTIKFKNLFRPYTGQNLNGKTLLVFRTGGIGDLLFIQPNLIYLKEKYPDCTINFACGPQYQAMVETWDCIDNLLDLPYSLKYLTQADYHALFEGVIERCRQAETENSYNLFSKWLGLNLPDEKLVPKQEAKPERVKDVKDQLEKWGIEDFIVLQLRASSPIRTPRPQFWANIIQELTSRGHNVVITDTPKQAENVDEFMKMLKTEAKEKTYNFAHHSKSLDYTIALTKLSKCVIATDSALNHIAASLGVPCYGIYGPFPVFIRLKTYPNAD